MNILPIILIAAGAGIILLTAPEVASIVGITIVPETAALGIGMVGAGLLMSGVKL